MSKQRLLFLALTLIVGVISALGTIALVEAIKAATYLFFYRESGALHALPWWQLLLAPVAGGLLVGLLLRAFPMIGRYHGVSDVMEAAAMRGGALDVRTGAVSAIATVLSLGSGASLGREGPAIHLCATVSAWLAKYLKFSPGDSLVLLGCGAAAAVTASFNAPIAGVLFALEVIVGYYSLRVLTPTVISTIAAVIVTRQILGDSPAFSLPDYAINSWWEMPAFALLGVVSGLIALALIYCVRGTQILWARTSLPIWMRPMVAGLIIGLVAIQFPLVLGVGYEATDMALRGSLPVFLLFAMCAAKVFATGVCLGSGFAGGVFSPALFIGAMLGGSFWWGAVQFYPDLASAQGVYSVVGMAGVASALLGAPISTLLIIFELTADYQLVVAVMLAAAIASTVMQQSPHSSFFRWQLQQRGINLNRGRNQSLLMTTKVETIVSSSFSRVDASVSLREARSQMVGDGVAVVLAFESEQFIGSATLGRLSSNKVQDDPETDVVPHLLASSFAITRQTSLNGAMALMDQYQIDCVPVIDPEGGSAGPYGVVYRGDVLRAYNDALRAARDEEYGVN
ncbi:MAG: chloride channel protein [Pseudomonadota bacterium]